MLNHNVRTGIEKYVSYEHIFHTSLSNDAVCKVGTYASAYYTFQLRTK